MDRSRQERLPIAAAAESQTSLSETIDGSVSLSGAPSGRESAGPPGADRAVTEPNEARAVVTVRATRIGRFTLLHQLGQGGMGAVYAAYDQELDRRVALKLLHQRAAGNTLQRQRTLHEARAVARISHPNVISLYDVGQTDEHIYIAMEYVDGETLASWQSRGGHSWREILDMYLLAGAGLHAAHTAGVVHRDFKPDNVLCGKDGRLRVADFGVARIGWGEEPPPPAGSSGSSGEGAGTGDRLTQWGVISGTPGYMSPEQYRGGVVDARSDQWSFCAALFEALYGQLPFGGETLAEKSESVHGSPRPRPRNTPVPQDVHQLLLRGLRVEPAKRFISMEVLLTALALESGDHAAGRALSRNVLLKAFVGVCLAGFALLQLRNTQRTASPRDLLVAASMVLLVTLSIGLIFRRSLLENRFHRAMWIICVVHMVQNTLQRLLALKLGLRMEALFPFEMVVMAANSAYIGIFLVPKLRWLWTLPVAAAVLSLAELASFRQLSVVYVLISALVALGWSRAAPQPRAR